MVSFKVNGKAVEFDGMEDTPLLWVIREHVALTGTKFGCGIGQCGACTVHINGTAQRTCITPVSAVNGAEVTTIEGLSEDGSHPVQQAWVELDVPQCGYCQAGQIMSAVGLLAENPRPSPDEIDEYMWGNACRCATYQRIRAGVQRAAEILGA